MPAKITRMDEITSCTQFGNTQIRLKYVGTLDYFFPLVLHILVCCNTKNNVVSTGITNVGSNLKTIKI